MAMNGDTMATAIIAAINTLSNEDKADQEKVMKAMCGAIVSHIQTNATISVTNVTAVQPGGGVSGPGSGTIS